MSGFRRLAAPGQAPAPTVVPPQLPVPEEGRGSPSPGAAAAVLPAARVGEAPGLHPQQPSPQRGGRFLRASQSERALREGPRRLARWRAPGAGLLPGPSQWRATSGVGPALGREARANGSAHRGGVAGGGRGRLEAGPEARRGQRRHGSMGRGRPPRRAWVPGRRQAAVSPFPEPRPPGRGG